MYISSICAFLALTVSVRATGVRVPLCVSEAPSPLLAATPFRRGLGPVRKSSLHRKRKQTETKGGVNKGRSHTHRMK